MTVGTATTTPSVPASDRVLQPGVKPSSQNSGFFAAVGSMASRVGSIGGDVGSVAGLKSGEDGLELKPANLATLGVMNVGVAGAIALAKRGDLPPGVTQGFGETLTETAKQAGTNGLRVTPTLVSAIAGPALADGVTYLAPNLLPKYKKEMKAPEKQKVQITRAIVGGAVIGLAAGVTFLVKPDLFKKFGTQFISDEAIKGATSFVTGGTPGVAEGALNAASIAKNLSAAGTTVSPGAITVLETIKGAAGPTTRYLVDGTRSSMIGVHSAAKIAEISGGKFTADAVHVLKTMQPMSRDAAFSNRVLLGTAGGIGTLMLANKAAGEDGDGKRTWGAAAAVAGAATIGGIAAMGKMTNSIGALQNTGFMFKPNVQWVKEYATKIAPITAVPAGAAASQYFDIVSDFDDITAARSPFRK